jgi:hypothetical protein
VIMRPREFKFGDARTQVVHVHSASDQVIGRLPIMLVSSAEVHQHR